MVLPITVLALHDETDTLDRYMLFEGARRPFAEVARIKLLDTGYTGDLKKYVLFTDPSL